MLNQFSLYIIIGLILLLVATGVSFALYRRITISETAILRQQNAMYALTVHEQSRTIETLQYDAKRLADANRTLTNRIVTTEMEFADEWRAIDALSLYASEEGRLAEK